MKARIDKKSESGAASVLVMFMMIVLITLGAFSISAANVNLKLCRKATTWNKTYYELDGQGEKYLSGLDYLLANAEALAVEYISQGGYCAQSYPDVPDSIQSTIFNLWMAEGINDKFIESTLNKIFLLCASEELRSLSFDYPENTLSFITGNDDSPITGLVSEIDLTSNVNADFHLKISVSINNLDYHFTTTLDKISGKKSPDASRYAITKWSQWQTQTDTSKTEAWDWQINLP